MIETDNRGISTKFVPQPDGTVVIQRYQDSQPVVDFVSRMKERPMRGDLRYVGSVPNVLLEQWMAEVGFARWRAMGQKERTKFIVGKMRSHEFERLRVGAI